MLFTALLAGAGTAAAVAIPSIFERQDTTTGIDGCMNPQNTQQNTDVFTCPHKYTMNDQGNCPGLNLKNNCVTYCEVRNSWFYGKEVPFPNTHCSAGDATCPITATVSVAIENSYSFTVGATLGKRDDMLETRQDKAPVPDPAGPGLDAIKLGFNFGATWGWSKTTTHATANTNTKPKEAGAQCGYWTFVPYYVTSCGTITIGDPNTGGNTPANPASSMCQKIRSVGNFCQTTPYLNKDGSAAGETIFVATDCTHNWPSPFCFQQAAYLQQGVAANASVYNGFRTAHWDGDINSPKGILSTAQVQCQKGNWPPPW